jgi:hypothetical protein
LLYKEKSGNPGVVSEVLSQRFYSSGFVINCCFIITKIALGFLWENIALFSKKLHLNICEKISLYSKKIALEHFDNWKKYSPAWTTQNETSTQKQTWSKYDRHIFVIVITYICNCDYIYL